MTDREYQMQCLADWMLSQWHTRQQRRASLDRMRIHQAKACGEEAADAFIAELERRIQAEWDRRRRAAA